MNKVKLSNSLQKFATTVYWQMVMSINLTNVFSIFIAVKRQGRKKAYLFWPIRSWTWTLKGWMDLKFWRNLIWLTHLWGRRCSEQKTPGRDTKKNKIKFILQLLHQLYSLEKKNWRKRKYIITWGSRDSEEIFMSRYTKVNVVDLGNVVIFNSLIHFFNK